MFKFVVLAVTVFAIANVYAAVLTSSEDKQERKEIVESMTPFINGSTANPIGAAEQLANFTQTVINVYDAENGKAVDATASAKDMLEKCKAATTTNANADDDDEYVIVPDDIDANDAE